MPLTWFTDEWAQACASQINQHTGYREAAKTWQWPLVLMLRANTGDRGVFLDLMHGECRSAHLADENDLDHAEFMISASDAIWRQVLGGKLDPITALMTGRLKLERGNLVTLTRYVRAAQAMLEAARQVETSFETAAATTAPAHMPTSPTPKTDSTRRFQTTSPRGLNHTLPAMKLYHKGKKLGLWDPRDIDFTQDAADWQKLNPLERTILIHLTALFQAGEEAVTLDLLPLIMVIAQEGRLEEEMYLTEFLFEEAKHVEVFRRFFDEVTEDHTELATFHSPAYHTIFYEELPGALNRLRDDSSPAAQAAASVTYNMIVEGVLAETGYHAYNAILKRNQIMPGMQQVTEYLKRDESRHLAYGVFLLSRLVAEHGDPIWEAIEIRMGQLFSPAIEIINEIFSRYEVMPFGLELDEFVGYAMSQFQKRMARIEKARGQSLEEILKTEVEEEL